MSVGLGGFSAPAGRAGLNRSIDVSWGPSCLANLSAESTAAGVLTNLLVGVDRFGGVLPNTMPAGGQAFVVGSNAKGAGTLGQRSIGGVQAVLMLGAGAAALAPLDVFSQFSPTPFLTRPAEDFEDPHAVWEVGIIARCGIPAGPITRDVGLVIMANTSTTSYPVGLRGSSVIPNPTQAGFALVFSGAQGTDVRFIARRTDTAVPPTRDVSVATLGAAASYCRLAIRIFSATRDREARLACLVNGRRVHEESWGAGTVLPDKTSITGVPGNFIGAFRPFVRNDTEAAQAVELGVRSFYVRAAASEADLL
jgi:hypothetical protein